MIERYPISMWSYEVKYLRGRPHQVVIKEYAIGSGKDKGSTIISYTFTAMVMVF